MLMKRILLVIIVLLIPVVKAQVTYNGPAQGSIPGGETVNTSDFNNLKSYPPQGINIINHFEPVVSPMYIESGNITVKRKEFFLLNDNVSAGDSVIIFKNFEGIPETSSFPPDPYIAAGPGHLVQVVNRRFRITDKDGNTLKEIVAEDWFSGLIPGLNPFDPKVIYDHFNKRWIMVWLSHNNTLHNAYYLISVSDDDDPLGTWFNWALPADQNGNQNSNNWSDYEGVGFDKNAIYFTSSQFSFDDTYQYDRIRIIDNNYLYTNNLPDTVKWIDLWGFTYPHNSNNMYSIRPVRMQNQADKYYFVHVPANGANFITLLKLTNSVTNPELTGDNIIFDYYYLPQNALQKGGPERIEGGGCFLRNEPVFKDGRIHFIHSIRNSIDEELSSLQYLCIDPVTNEVIKNIEMGDREHFYFYPSLAINAEDNLLFTFSRSSSNEFAGAFFTILPDVNSAPLPAQILQEGLDYYVKDGGGGRNRWGDYSGAWLDPEDSSGFWIMTEFVKAENTWGTKVGGIRYEQQVPVELVSFDITSENNTVLLQWKTATEINNKGFEVQRSEGGGQRSEMGDQNGWKKIGFVEGYGTSTEEKNYSFTNADLTTGDFFYRLKQIDFNGSYTYSNIVEVKINQPDKFSLSQNYPNPFNPTTTINYTIPNVISSPAGRERNLFVTLKVYNVLGKEVETLVNEEKLPGVYSVEFNSYFDKSAGRGQNLSSGIYFYQLTVVPNGRQAGSFSSTKKMILLK